MHILFMTKRKRLILLITFTQLLSSLKILKYKYMILKIAHLTKIKRFYKILLNLDNEFINHSNTISFKMVNKSSANVKGKVIW